MSTIINLPIPHPGQQTVLNSTARFRVVCCGRRWGKTSLGIRAILIHAIHKKQTCWWLAPSYKMADPAWRALTSAVRAAPGVTISHTHRRIDFPGGGSIQIRSAHDPDSLRGAGLDFVVLDEAAYMKPQVWPEVIRPMLVESRGRAIFLSSPRGKNWFFDLFQRGLQSPDEPAPAEGNRQMARDDNPTLLDSPPHLRAGAGVASTNPASNITPVAAANPPSSTQNYQSFHFPTAANPLLSPDELESIRRETSERTWQIEYLAQFEDDLGQVFRGVRQVTTAPLNPAPSPEQRCVMSIDWGRERNCSAMIVEDSITKAVLAVDYFNKIDWPLQYERIKTLAERWNVRTIYAEVNSIGSPNITALQRAGLPVRPFNTTNTSKAELIESLSLAIERCEITLPPHEALLSQLAAFRVERLPSGNYRYTAPPGQNDDLVIALALAHYASQRSGIPILSA